MDKLAGVLNKYSSFSTDIDNILSELFQNNAEYIEEIKAMHNSVTSISGANVDEVLTNIQKTEKLVCLFLRMRQF